MMTTSISIPTLKNKILCIHYLYKKIRAEIWAQNECLEYYENLCNNILFHLYKLYQICETLQREKGYRPELQAVDEVYKRLNEWEVKNPHDLRELGGILIGMYSKLESECTQKLNSLRTDQISFLRYFGSQEEEIVSDERPQINIADMKKIDLVNRLLSEMRISE